MDREANIFAAVALLPTHLLRRDEQIMLDGYYPRELARIRFNILKEYGL